MWVYRDEDSSWVECELLHEFLEDYQIRYYSSTVGEVEKVVKRDTVREVPNE
jgi:hypothetical protein